MTFTNYSVLRKDNIAFEAHDAGTLRGRGFFARLHFPRQGIKRHNTGLVERGA